MKKIKIALVCVVILAISIASAGFCAPSFKGYTGLMNIPTADALSKSSWNIGAFTEDIGSDSIINDVVANYGVSEGVEIGINRFRCDDDSQSDTLLNGKYAIRRETDKDAGMAAGIIDATDEINTTVYFVVSKSFTNKLGTYDGDIISPRVHVGIGGGELDGLFGGVSVFLGNHFELMAEYDTENFNLGARLHITRNIGISAGFFDVSDASNFGLGASFAMHY